MIKNKILGIKIIFKTYLKILKTGKKIWFQIDFYSIKIIKQFSKTIFHNCFKKQLPNRHYISYF